MTLISLVIIIYRVFDFNWILVIDYGDVICLALYLFINKCKCKWNSNEVQCKFEYLFDIDYQILASEGRKKNHIKIRVCGVIFWSKQGLFMILWIVRMLSRNMFIPLVQN